MMIIFLGILSGVLSSLFQTGIIIAPGIFLFSSSELGFLIALVVVLYFLYKKYITFIELLVFFVAYFVSNFMMNMIKKIVL